MTDDPGRRRRAHGATIAVLGAALLLGGALRTHRIAAAEPFLWDDAIHHLEAIYLVDLVRFGAGSAARQLAERRGGGDLWTSAAERERYAREVGGLPLRHARPAHSAALAGTMAAAGGPVPYAGPLVAAASGTATLLVLWGLVRRTAPPIGGALPAAVAALWLAVDPLHVRLSREGLADADGTLFALLALAAWLRSREPDRGGRAVALAGLLAGVAFLFQTRNFLLIVLVLAWELVPGPWRAPPSPDARPARRVALYLAAAALPLVACELPYYAAFLAGRSRGLVPSGRPYSLQVLAVFARHGGALSTWAEPSVAVNLLSYPVLARLVHGTWAPVAAGVLAVVATVAAARESGRPGAWVLATWLAGGWLFLSATVPLARYAAFLAPALAWAVGVAMGRVAAALRGQRAGRTLSSRLAPIACGLVVAAAWGTSLRASVSTVRDVVPGYREAVAWIVEHGGGAHWSTQPFVSQVWTGEPAELPPADLREAAVAGGTPGRRYVLVDAIRNYMVGAFAPRAAAIRALEVACGPPAAVFANAWAARPEYVFEFNYDLRATLGRLAEAASDPDAYGTIAIYDLARCTDAGAGEGAP